MTGLLIDNFAGGGGASHALEAAFGRKVDIAINHDAKALAMHAANHPETLHLKEDVFSVDPFEVCDGRPIDAAWFSPDCKHFSRAKGGKPVDKRIRGLAWVVLRWASLPDWQRPRVIFLENVEEFLTWGPVGDDGFPIKDRAGQTFAFWKRSLEKRGYVIDWRIMRACDYGAPTIRKRLFLVARCDGEPIRWPAPTHFDPKKGRPPQVRVKLAPYRTAAEIIDWSIPCPSIFGRKRSLAENTLRRIARGVMRYVVDNPRPFIVPVTRSYGDDRAFDSAGPLPTITTAKGGEFTLVTPFVAPLTHQGDSRTHPLDEPMRTVTGAHRGEHVVIAPTIVSIAHGDSGGRREYPADDPLGTVQPNGNKHALVGATLIQTSWGERPGQAPRAMDIQAPLGTVVAGGIKHAVIAAHLNTTRNAMKPFNGADEPVHTITAGGAHINLVSAFLAQFNTNPDGSVNAGHEVTDPVSTIASRGPHQAIAAAHLLSLKGCDRRDGPIDAPAPAICAGGGHVAEVRAFLLKYYGTGAFASGIDEPVHSATAKARFGLVMVAGEPYEIVDIGMRMLTPRELFNAQGFAPEFKIDVEHEGRPLTKSDQIEKCGNSVSPPPAIALAVANAPIMSRLKRHGEREIAIA